MDTNSFAFVDSNNHTLANFGPTTSAERLLDELNAVRAQDPAQPVFVLRGHEMPDRNGAAHIVTDAALKVLGIGGTVTASVEVLHASPPNFLADPKENDVYPRANYQAQATLVVSQDNSLNDAYRYSQNIDLQRSASLTFAEITERGEAVYRMLLIRAYC